MANLVCNIEVTFAKQFIRVIYRCFGTGMLCGATLEVTGKPDTEGDEPETIKQLDKVINRN